MGNLYSGVHGVREQICSRSKAKFSTVQRAARIALLVLLLFGCFFGFLGFFLLLLLGVLLGILLLVLLLQQRLHVVSGFVVFLPELLSNLDIRKTDGKDALISLSVCVVHRRPYPRSLTSNVLLQLDVGIDVVVEANLQSFFSAHEQSNTLVFVVLQYFDVTQAALLPAALTGMAEEFRPPKERGQDQQRETVNRQTKRGAVYCEKLISRIVSSRSTYCLYKTSSSSSPVFVSTSLSFTTGSKSA
mmetsp:Transcript_17524/g.70951  ORF Transcript_17524/g.70951 Transcript_17524/m.70951 type:complete len:245 (-) Transcript_17524:223-957(-)